MSSETTIARKNLLKYCTGYGLDLGYGGDPITPSAITVDLPKPYTNVGDSPLNLGGDARDLYWFKDEVFDFVYSSHLLEDFPANETLHIMREWLRVIKPGGNLVLFLPDEQIYRKHCDETGQNYNLSHSIDNMSLDYIKKLLLEVNNVEIIHETPLIGTYSFEIVIKKLKLPVELKLKNFIENNKGKKVCFYGAGSFAKEIIEKYDLSDINILGIIDKNPDKKGQKIGKYEICTVKDITELNPDFIVTTVLEPSWVQGSLKYIKLVNNLNYKIETELFL